MEQKFDLDNFRFLFETRLRKMGLDDPIVAADLKAKLSSGDPGFDLQPLSKPYKDGSKLNFYIANFEQGKKEENKHHYYMNGPVIVQYHSPEGELIKAQIPLDSQQGPHIDAIKNIMDGNTPYLTVKTSQGPRDKMYILTGEKDEHGVRVVRDYSANIDELRKDFDKLPIVGLSAKQKEFLFDSVLKGNIHNCKLRNAEGVREELYIQASRSNDMLTRDKDGMTVSLNKSGLEAVNTVKQETPNVDATTKALMEKMDNPAQENSQAKKQGIS